MNTKIIAIAVGVVVIVGGAYALLTKNNNKTGSEAEQGTTMTGTFRDIAATGFPQKCSVESTKGGYTSTGVVYVAEGLMRGDFITADAPSGSIESHMIVKENVSYVWSSAAPQGIKMNLTSSANGGGVTSTSDGFSYDDRVNYTCSPWSVSQDLFALPAGISFIDIATLPGPGGSAGAGAEMTGTAEQCKACDGLSGAQKAQCLVALSCK